jgi:hypothetical protein
MIKIQKTICREELKSRIPALFAYIEENDAGEFKLHKATDSPQGCYGKIIENMIINASLTVDGQSVIISGNTYSYRTIMNTYYQYKNNEEVVNDNKSFFDFIDRAIGKIEINLDELGLNETDNDLVPHYIYLANARRLFNQYSKMKIVYDYYTGGDDTFDVNALEGDICCLCAKYRRMGGTVMYNKLKEFISKAENIANEYYDYISENKLTFNLNLVLNQSIHDIGYLSCYLNEWVGGDEHFEGELYTYNGRTYRCTETNHDIYNKETMRFEFDNTKFELIPQTKINPNGGTDYQLKGSSDSKLKSLRRFKQYINGQDKEESQQDRDKTHHKRSQRRLRIATQHHLGQALLDQLNDPTAKKKNHYGSNELQAKGNNIFLNQIREPIRDGGSGQFFDAIHHIIDSRSILNGLCHLLNEGVCFHISEKFSMQRYGYFINSVI